MMHITKVVGFREFFNMMKENSIVYKLFVNNNLIVK